MINGCHSRAREGGREGERERGKEEEREKRRERRREGREREGNEGGREGVRKEGGGGGAYLMAPPGKLSMMFWHTLSSHPTCGNPSLSLLKDSIGMK